MSISKLALLLLSGALAAVHSSPISPDSSVLVTIPDLGRIQGQRNRTAATTLGISRDFYSFTGIPYGKIPQRFSPAVAVDKLTDDESIFDGTQKQLACWQVASPLQPGPFTEDCLSLNVFTPKLNGGKPLPVIFFIHGGSFIRWSGNMFDGRRLLNKDCVLVSINYRLNIFGLFSTTNDLAPGNLALYDQILALQWVNKHISHFGGDPSRVTIAGQSAGGASVTYLLDSPMAQGLFHGAISSSGDNLAGWAIYGNPLQNSLSGASFLGCYNATNPTDLENVLQCMRQLPPQNLLAATASAFYSAPSVQSYPLQSIPKVVPTSPTASLSSPNRFPVPLMIGANKQDGSFLLSRIYSSYLVPTGLINNPDYLKHKFLTDLLTGTSFGMTDLPIGMLDSLVDGYLGKTKNSGNFETMAPGMVDIFTAFYFKAPSVKTAKAQSKFADTFLYSFDYYGEQTFYPFTGGVPQVPRGVTHVDDLMYVFYFTEYTSLQDKIMSSMMVDFYFNMASTGNPSGQLVKWPKYSESTGNFLKINAIPTTGTDWVGSWFHTYGLNILT